MLREHLHGKYHVLPVAIAKNTTTRGLSYPLQTRLFTKIHRQKMV